jgi:ferredoxin
MPMTVINLSKMIEDEGYEAIPYGHQSDWRAIDNKGFIRKGVSRPVAPGKPIPDIMVHLRIAAYLCGLGEIGYSKMFLTPEFGPRNRVGIIITEAEFEPDPIIKPGTICNRCMACVKDCPGNCISETKTVKQKLGGYDVEWGDLDEDKCDVYFAGGENTNPGETGSYLDGRTDRKPNFISPFFKKPRNLYNSGQAVCGARGCTRACMISLETRGVLKNKFHNKFRTEKPWTMDWSAEAVANDKPAAYKPPHEVNSGVESKTD